MSFKTFKKTSFLNYFLQKSGKHLERCWNFMLDTASNLLLVLRDGWGIRNADKNLVGNSEVRRPQGRLDADRG